MSIGWCTFFYMKQKRVKITKVLSQNITKLREARGWSQSRLAREIDVSRQAVWNLENGESWITLDKVDKLAKAFQIEEHELFKPPMEAIHEH